jgi:hypothetical protein
MEFSLYIYIYIHVTALKYIYTWHSSSNYLVVNVPYVHLLPKYRPPFDVSLPPEDDPKFLACCVLSENLQQFDFGVSTSSTGDGYTNDFKWLHKYKSSGFISCERGARQLVHFYLSIDQEAFDSGACGQIDSNVW